jgi:hypothetical protein
MDTSAASRSFSVQVTINLDKQQKHIFQSEKTTSDNTAIKWVTDANNSRYTTAMADTKPGKIILNKTQMQSTKAASLVKE